MRVLPIAVASLLAAHTAYGQECPKPNQKEYDSYTVVTAQTSTELWVPPKVKKQPKPKYPDAARQKGLWGTVVLEVIIDENGCVAAARVVRSIPLFDQAALDCVAGWRFVPARSGEKAVATKVNAPVSFVVY